MRDPEDPTQALIRLLGAIRGELSGAVSVLWLIALLLGALVFMVGRR